MSAPADSSTVPGNASTEGKVPVDQHGEDVAMDKLPHPSSAAATPADTPADPATAGASSQSQLPPLDTATASAEGAGPSTAANASQQQQQLPPLDTATAAAEVAGPSSVSKDVQDITSRPSHPKKADSEDFMAIGSAVDDIKSITPGAPDAGPVCNITLLHAVGGGRHPYKIDARYLARRNVEVPDLLQSGQPDPFSISIYTLKELILREWRNDWEDKPSSPGSIRLIHFGQLLDDKEPLKRYHFSNENPNVVHMSVRPADLDEEEPKSSSKAAGGSGGDGRRARGEGGCCSCVVM
jgi:hypothetical protein